MTPPAIFSILFDCVSQSSSSILVVGVVCGVAAYIASAAYIALRARYERSILAAASSCLEANLQTRTASANAEMVLPPVREPGRG
jgi:hypothetical protein